MNRHHYLCQGCARPLFVVATTQAGKPDLRWEIDHQDEGNRGCSVLPLLPLLGEATQPEALEYAMDVLTPLRR
ncbi:hypothetical protein [Streptomyces sp. NPDC050145]|uniref:hypothetical protein n=1 Tax=Streptomyces sp. NPDC050145 TaxID=3365602 RepID=UPI00379800F0